MRSIGRNIRDLRTKKNITQEALAETLFVTRQTVSNYETGRSQPDVAMLLKIADALGVDANALIYGPPKQPSRRAALVRMAVGGGILAALCIIALAVGPVERFVGIDMQTEARYNAYDLRIALLYPAMLLAAGWCAVQALSLLFRFEPPRRKLAVIARWALLAVLAFVMLTLVQYRLACDFPDSFIAALFYAGWNKLYGAFALAAYPFPRAFFIVGAALWLLGFPRTVRLAPDSGGSSAVSGS